MLSHQTYLHASSKEWVTFVHGAGGSSNIWYKQIRSFCKDYNVLVLDLRGHGKSKAGLLRAFDTKYTFDNTTEDIIELLDYLKIRKSHFVGISLGTILIRNLAKLKPQYVESMIMGGAVMRLDFRSQVLLKSGVVLKSIVPYMYLYKLFAFIIMPRKNHKQSRLLFINEAKKLYRKEFIRWFRLASKVNPLLKLFRLEDVNIPTLYLMGEQDHMFLPAIKKLVFRHTTAVLHVVPNCGHVVNLEQASTFNRESISFIKSLG